MTRNQQILLIMGWARSFYGLYLDDAVMIAEQVLDEVFDGDIGDADAQSVIKEFDKAFFECSSSGKVVPSDQSTPVWEDYDLVRPAEAIIEEGNYTFHISDRTFISATDYAETLLENEVIKSYGPFFNGLKSDGTLILQSGGEIPPLSDEARAVVWPTIFSDPEAATQETIDALVADPPSTFEPQNYVEKKSLEAYVKMVDAARVMIEEIENNPERSIGHYH